MHDEPLHGSQDPIVVSYTLHASAEGNGSGGKGLVPDVIDVRPRYRRKVLLPLVLFGATCISTFWAGATQWQPIEYLDNLPAAARALLQNWQQGLVYMLAVLAVLLAHEMGHFLMAVRYRIPASFPYFLPFPLNALGTLGAVIAMQGTGRADRRQLFDVGLAGPLAGLAVALPMLWIGARLFDPHDSVGPVLPFSNPWIFQWIMHLVRPECPPESFAHLNHANPFLVAGWAAMLVTGLNMIPISQLDGSHVVSGLLGRRAMWLNRGALIAIMLYILAQEQYIWVPMLALVILLGVDHPPTADDDVPLGWPRRVLGWTSLLIPLVCMPSLDLSLAALGSVGQVLIK